MGFTTARPEACGSFRRMVVLDEELMNLPFRAIGECAEEAILQSLWHAEPDTALDGTHVPSWREIAGGSGNG